MGEPAPVYSVAIVGLIWLPIPFGQSSNGRVDAITVVSSVPQQPAEVRKSRLPREFAVIRHRDTRSRSASGGGSRSASAAPDRPPARRWPAAAKSQLADAEPADLDQAGQFRRRAHDQLASAGLQIDPVVADQHGRRDLPGAAGQDQIERQPRLAGAGRPADQHGAVADQHGRRVDARPPCAVMSPATGPRSGRRRSAARRRRWPGRCGSRPRSGRHGPRRSAWRSTARDRNSGQSPDAAGRCKTARRSAPARPRGCPARRRRRRFRFPIFTRRQTMRTLPPGSENDWALTSRLEITWPSRESWPGTEKVSVARPSKRTSTPTSWPSLVSLATERQRGQQAADVDRRHVVALQFGIEPAGVRNVGDQPVEPLDVVFDHGEQPRAAVLVVRQRQRLDRRAQRRQRVLQFVRDVGGEASRSPRCGYRARRSCRAARRRDGRSRRGGG